MANIFDLIGLFYDKIFPCPDFSFLLKEFEIKKGDKVLDMGGGTGRLAREIAKKFQTEVTVLDISESMLKNAKKYPFLKTILGNMEKTDFPSDSFDVIVCADAIHHFKNPEKTFSEMRRILKPEGRIYLEEFDIKKLKIKFLRFSEKYFLLEPGNFYSPKSLEKSLESHGFQGFFKFLSPTQYLYIGKALK